MYIKNFDNWNRVKKEIQSENRKVHIRSGEVRWCVIGVNLGSEIDGKGDSYTRPVLVLHVIGSKLALVIPITTKIKTVPGYYEFKFHDKNHCLCLNQIRVISSKRLLKRKGRITKNRLFEIKNLMADFYSLPGGYK